MVHVHHRDAVGAACPLQGLVERAAPGQAGQLIAEGHVEGLLQHRAQHQQQGRAAQCRQQHRLQEHPRQHPPQAQQGQQHRRVQRARMPPGLPAQRGGGQQEQQRWQLRQRVPVDRDPRPVTVRQQIVHAARLLRGQQQEDQQSRAAGDGAQQQVVAAPPALRPQRQAGEQQWQPRRDGMEAQRCQRADMAAAQVAADILVQQREHDRHHQQQAQRTYLVVEQGKAGAEAGQQPGQDALRRAGHVCGIQCGPYHHGNQQGGQHEQVVRRLAERMQGQAGIPAR